MPWLECCMFSVQTGSGGKLSFLSIFIPKETMWSSGCIQLVNDIIHGVVARKQWGIVETGKRLKGCEVHFTEDGAAASAWEQFHFGNSFLVSFQG